MADVLYLVTPDRVNGAACRDVVQHMAVGPGDDGGVVAGLGTALDLQAVHPRVHEVVQMVDHAHVAAVHNIGALFILKHGEVFAGALFLHQGVLIAAGLGALAPVGVPARHIVAEQTPSRVADAHGPVTEGLDLQLSGHLGPDGADLVQTQLTGQHHAGGPQIVPCGGGGVVGDGLLGGDMPLTVGGVFARQRKGAQVGHDQGVHPGVVQPLQMGGQPLHLTAAGHGVDGDVHLHAVVMGVLYGPGQLLVGKVTGEGAHAEGGARQVHRVGAVGHGHLQFFPVPGRGQQFRLFSFHQSGWYMSLLIKARCSL